MGEQLPPEGWYADNDDASIERWWDGAKWTGATREKPPPPSPTTQPEEAGRTIGRALTWFVAGLFLLGFVGCMAVLNGSGDDDAEFDEFDAQVACEGFVEDRLVSPGTADFQRPERVHVGANEWRITGSVDAGNRLGGTVRMDYVCTVRGTGTTATLVSLDVTER